MLFRSQCLAVGFGLTPQLQMLGLDRHKLDSPEMMLNVAWNECKHCEVIIAHTERTSANLAKPVLATDKEE